MQKPHNKEEMEMLLWSYIHDSISLMERKEVEAQLAESPALQAQLREIKETEGLFAQQEEEPPAAISIKRFSVSSAAFFLP